jgi:hypothetical protein
MCLPRLAILAMGYLTVIGRFGSKGDAVNTMIAKSRLARTISPDRRLLPRVRLARWSKSSPQYSGGADDQPAQPMAARRTGELRTTDDQAMSLNPSSTALKASATAV